MENTNKIDIGTHRRNTVIEILKKLQEHDRVCCVRYTGYGKTYYIIKQLIDMFPNKQFLIFVPAKSLIKRYKQIFLNSNVIIKTYQSLLFMKNNEIEDSFSNMDYIICDEAHRLGKNKWRQSIKNAFDIINNGNTKIIGLTATPKRGDKIDIIEDFFNGIETSRFDLLDGIQAGYIPKIDYVVAYCDLSGLNKEIYDERMEDVDRYEIDKLLNVSNIIKENISKDKLKENLKVVLYVSRLMDIDTAVESCNKWFTEAFPNKNIKVFSLSSEYTDKENSDYLDDYSDDEDNDSIDIMISCNKLNEGLHLPKCSVAILLRKTSSPIVYFQQIGRAINGARPVIFDLIDNSSHIKQIENYYEQGNLNKLDLSIQSNRDKKMFSKCVNLIYKTKDVENILNKFKRSKLTSSEITSICDLYKNGDTIKNIISTTGRSESCVKSVINKYCTEYKHKRICEQNNRNKLNNIEILKLYKEGKSIERLARMFHCSSYKIREAIPDELVHNKFRKQDRQSFIKEICNLYDNGMSVQDIANKMGRSPTSIRDILSSNPCTYERKIKRNISDDEKSVVCNLYKLGYSKNKINQNTGISFKVINRILCNEMYGCTQQQKIISRDKHKRNLSKDEQNKVCNLYKKLLSVRKVAVETKLSDNCIRNILYNNNIEIISNGGVERKVYTPPYTKEEIDNVIITYKRVKNQAETARIVGMCNGTVNKLLKYRGIK